MQPVHTSQRPLLALSRSQMSPVKRDGLSRPASLGGHVDCVQAAIASVAFFAPIHATIPNPILLMMSAML